MEVRILPTRNGESESFMMSRGSLESGWDVGVWGMQGLAYRQESRSMGTPEPGPKGAHLDILLLKREMKDSVLQDPTSFFQCALIEYLSAVSIVP